MARCNCGGGQCNCSFVADPSINIHGRRSAANPAIISAEGVTCDEARPCFSAGYGAACNRLQAPHAIDQEWKVRAGSRAGEAPQYPGRGAFVIGRCNPAVIELDTQLMRFSFTHHDGKGYQPGPLVTDYRWRNVADLQWSRPELSGDPDGYPGPVTWELAHTLPA